jgi:tetratricopeptide (TPR) repeat protein
MPPLDRDAALRRAEKALRQGRIDAAIAEYLHVTEAEPRDWTSAHALGDLYARAGQVEKALAQYARTADQLAAEGFAADALTLFQKSLKLKPGDDYASTRVREISRQTGAGTPEGVPSDVAKGVPSNIPVGGHRFSGAEIDDALDVDDERSPWLAMAEVAFTDGRVEEGRQALAEALQFDPGAKETALAMAYRVATASPDAGYEVIDVIVDRSVGENDYPAAAAALQEFVTRAPHHLVALMRLVEVAMEGGLEAAMYEAQAQLTDAYLDAGRGLEARIISEDLVAREPWNRANIERFRKALGLLGEPDPDAVIAGRLSGESPFLATDLADFDASDDGDDGIEVFDGSTSLTISGAPVEESVPSALDRPPSSTARLGMDDRAAADCRLGLAYRDLGLLDDAVRAFEAGIGSERWRFHAASWLAAVHRARGHSAPAIEWLDKAARWAPPATDIGRAVRYDLGGVLEAVGDHDRALAVFTGLESEQPGYRDVSVRIQRLLDPEPRG